VHRVTALVFDGMKMLDLAGPLEVFAEAGRPYVLEVRSVDGHDVVSSTGVRVPVDGPVREAVNVGTALIVGGDALPVTPIPPELIDAAAWLSGAAQRTASICTGAFLLAAAGLLDGRRATTHWRHARLLAAAYPGIRVEPDALHIADGEIYTSAGVSAGIDLALALVEKDHGSDLVRDVARSLVVYLKRAGGQSQFSVLVEKNPPPDSALRIVTDAITADPAGNHSVTSLAAQAALSTRQLTRLFHAELGTTPARYVEMVRVDIGRAALDAGHTVGESARRAGFGSPETFRRVFVSTLGVSPRAYRDRFRSASPAVS
jgi:transcriptional regulator GlxA family with amidase domain